MPEKRQAHKARPVLDRDVDFDREGRETTKPNGLAVQGLIDWTCEGDLILAKINGLY
jgi:hypothetical protein